MRRVVLLDDTSDGHLGGEDRADVAHARDEPHLVLQAQVVGCGTRDGEHLPLTPDGHDLESFHELVGQQLDDLGVDLEVLGRRGGDAELPRQGERELGLGDVPSPHERTAESLAGALLEANGLVELTLGDSAGLDEQVAQSDVRFGGRDDGYVPVIGTPDARA